MNAKFILMLKELYIIIKRYKSSKDLYKKKLNFKFNTYFICFIRLP